MGGPNCWMSLKIIAVHILYFCDNAGFYSKHILLDCGNALALHYIINEQTIDLRYTGIDRLQIPHTITNTLL